MQHIDINYIDTTVLKNENLCVSYYAAATSVAPKPHIRDDFPSIIALQDSFQLNCSASYDSDVIVDLKWVVPNPKGVDVSASVT